LLFKKPLSPEYLTFQKVSLFHKFERSKRSELGLFQK
jgi:hypothetical protein